MKRAMHEPATPTIREHCSLRHLVLVRPPTTRRKSAGGGHRPQVACAQGLASIGRPSTGAFCRCSLLREHPRVPIEMVPDAGSGEQPPCFPRWKWRRTRTPALALSLTWKADWPKTTRDPFPVSKSDVVVCDQVTKGMATEALRDAFSKIAGSVSLTAAKILRPCRPTYGLFPYFFGGSAS